MHARFQNPIANNPRIQNVVTAVVAALLFAGFVGWAVVTDDNTSDDRLATIATTTTGVTLARVTTSTTATTAFVPRTTSPTTFAPLFTNTTARATVTTRRTTTTARSTATTRRTATTVASGPNGVVTEASDNSASFVHNSDGSTSESATPMPADPGAFVFQLTTKVLSASGTSAQVRFTVELTNRRGRSITFPGGLRINLTITPPEGSAFTFVVDAREVTGMQNGETVTAVSTSPMEGYGTFNVTGSCEVDYGS